MVSFIRAKSLSVGCVVGTQRLARGVEWGTTMPEGTSV